MIRIRTLLCAASAACGLALGFNAAAATFTGTVTIPDCATYQLIGGSLVCASGGGGPPPACTFIPAPASLTVGQTATPSIACTAGATYTWTVSLPSSVATATCGNAASCGITGVGPGTGTVGVSAVATDGSGTTIGSGTQSLTFVAAGGGGGKTIPVTCPDGTTTTSATLNSFTTGQGVTIDPFQNKQTAIWQINVPAMPANSAMVFPYAGNGGSTNALRVVYLSNTDPCDTSKLVGWTQSGAVNAVVNDGQSGITGSFATAVAHMKTGDTWYIIIKNQAWKSGSPPYPDSCRAGGDCPVLVSATPSIH